MVRSVRRPHRSGRKKVTRRKKDTWKTPAANPVIREAWNNKLTTKQNYRNIGLSFDSNAVLAAEVTSQRNVIVGEARIVDGKVVMEEAVSYHPAVAGPAEPTPVIKALQELEERGTVREMTLSEEQFKMLSRLRSRHGADLEKMARDIRRNPYQHTVAQLTRLFKTFDRDYEIQSAKLSALGVPL
eukprot:c11375_g1_i1.p2 GENE.c11375_g1_i1~~c11375_g1_i1.p2  ORF type:complete len:185 (+),score=34.10 c11375_g1_i1:120-674(+)